MAALTLTIQAICPSKYLLIRNSSWNSILDLWLWTALGRLWFGFWWPSKNSFQWSFHSILFPCRDYCLFSTTV